MKQLLLKFLCGTALVAAAGGASAQVTWDWSFNNAIYNGNSAASLSGTFTTASANSSAITGITGSGNFTTEEGVPVSASEFSLAAGFQNTQTFSGGGTANIGFTDSLGDTLSITTTTGQGGFFAYVPAVGQLAFSEGNFTATEEGQVSSTPEPSQVISLAAMSGLGGVGMLFFRRKK